MRNTIHLFAFIVLGFSCHDWFHSTLVHEGPAESAWFFLFLAWLLIGLSHWPRRTDHAGITKGN